MLVATAQRACSIPMSTLSPRILGPFRAHGLTGGKNHFVEEMSHPVEPPRLPKVIYAPIGARPFRLRRLFCPSVPAKIMNQQGLSPIMALSTTLQIPVQEQHTFGKLADLRFSCFERNLNSGTRTPILIGHRSIGRRSSLSKSRSNRLLNSLTSIHATQEN
jgi:hypothetical protein